MAKKTDKLILPSGTKFNVIKNKLARKVAQISQEYFEEAFDKEAFDGVKWKEVQRRIPGTKAYKAAKQSGRTNPILTKSTALRKSIKIMKATWDDIRIETVGSVNDYSDVHNEGTSTMPQRQFMGQSDELDKLVERLIEDELDLLFQ